MKNKTTEVYIKAAFWTIWSFVLIICVLYIVKNAHWTIGDDAIVMEHTGSGVPFLLSHMINKSVGRFCPLAYMAYNVLLLFGEVSPKAHYVLEAVFFVIFAVAFTVLALQMLRNQRPVWRYSIVFFALLLCIGRAYPQYTECFSTAWCGYTWLACFMLFSFLFHERQNWFWGVVALLLANIICYSSETGFILPLGIGGFALLFNWKHLSKKEKWFNGMLVSSALLFLAIYLVFIVPHVNHYMTHVIDSSPISNALRMLISQKIIIVGFGILLISFIFVVWKKQPYEYYDAFLLTAAAYFCANVILKLNWTLYYNGAALLCIPAILFYLVKYLNPQIVLFVVGGMGIFYGIKIPKAIKHSQEHRTTSFSQVEKLSNSISDGIPVYWVMPKESNGFGSMIRLCRQDWLTSYIRWIRIEEEFEFEEKIVGVDTLSHGIWLMSADDRISFMDELEAFKGESPCFKADSIYGYYVPDE